MTFAERYFRHLNNEQLEAVQTIDGCVLLLAVPGSGKTTVLVTRLGNMIYNHGIAPENILVLTYTKAATNDMERRFRSLFADRSFPEGLQFRTINSISLDIIRYCAELYGKTKTVFELVDGMTQYRVVHRLYIESANEYPTENEVYEILKQIAYCKNMMLSDEEIRKRESELNIPLYEIYSKYNDDLYKNRMMDYDDQLRYAYSNLKKYRDTVLAWYQNKYKYICVDEAQDTSMIQHEIIRILAEKNKNLFMVGDEDQSIYGFRAAYPEALLNFEKRFPGGKVLVMDYKYRSNANIVTAADYFVQHNKLRHKKSIKATRPEAEEIRYPTLKSRGDQYEYLLNILTAEKSQIAVLYRNNESGIPLIDLLDRHNVPYRIRQDEVGFFTNRVVTDVVDIIRFAMDPTDTSIFMRIYHKLHTYLKRSSADEACRIAKQSGISVMDALGQVDDISDSTLHKWTDIRSHMRVLLHETPESAILRIEKQIGYGEYLNDKHLDAGKLFTLRMIARNEETISGFLNRMDSLRCTISDSEPDYSANIILSTIHSSKGLEYDKVILIDVCDGVFPNNPTNKSKGVGTPEYALYEEERRIFYVAVTRAKDRLSVLKYKDAYSNFVSELQMEKLRRDSEKKRADERSMAKNSGSTKAYKKITNRNSKTSLSTAFEQDASIGAKCKHCGDDGKCWKRNFFKFNTNCNRPEKCSSFRLTSIL